MSHVNWKNRKIEQILLFLILSAHRLPLDHRVGIEGVVQFYNEESDARGRKCH